MARSREDMLAELRADTKVQAIVIGGGINGISTFRELALQGVRVLLVDRGDFCGACSSAPSRMIHGGLRYLENGEIGLVRESLRERDALLRNAPHFVRPLPTTVPIQHVLSGLLNSAFAARTEVLAGRMPGGAVGPYLSALLVGQEILGAEALFGGHSQVHLVADGALAESYGGELAAAGREVRLVTPEDAFVAGVKIGAGKRSDSRSPPGSS